MTKYTLVGKKIVPWTDDNGGEHVSVQLHMENPICTADGFTGTEVYIVKVNPEKVPNVLNYEIGTCILVEFNDKGRVSDVCSLAEFLESC